MNGFSLNGDAINGGGSFATIIYIPIADALVNFTLTEHNFVSLSGGLSFSIEPVGDIWTISNIGSGELDMQLNAAGSVSTVTLGPSGNSDVGFLVTGTMNPASYLAGISNKTLLTEAALTKILVFTTSDIATAIESIGNLSLTGGLDGSIDKDTLLAGNLTLGVVSLIPYAPTNISLAINGSLQGTYRFSGASLTDFVVNGSLAKMLVLEGTTVNVFTLDAYLANNAYTIDPASVTMIRKPINREMLK